MLLRVARRLGPRAAVGSLVLAAAAASCSSPKQYDDDDDNGGSPGSMGSGSGAKASGGTFGSGGSGSGATGATGGDVGTAGDMGTAGDVASGTGGSVETGGATATGGKGSGGKGGNGSGGDSTASGGATDAGAAGACSGPDCGTCTGEGCPVCGDLKVEGTESCDDGNNVPFDGCSSDCQIEPNCSGDGCQGACGDGIVLADEECDDGNTQDGDGCSTSCTVEPGYTCTTTANCDEVGGTCVVRLPVVFRDFNRSTVSGGHPDFYPGYNTSGALQGLVEPELDSDGKPVASATASATNGFIHSKDTFAQWYRDGAPSSGPIPGELVLWDDGAGGFVNRWGVNGEQWVGYPNTTGITYCYYGCDTCSTMPGPGQVCLDPCTVFGTGSSYQCVVDQVRYDGSPLFFPIDTAQGVLSEARAEGRVPEQYGWAGWQWESAVAANIGVTTPIPTACASFPSQTHNFNFTTEVKFPFRYDMNGTQVLSFLGDDDVWVFVNGHLAIDLGGWHVPLGATLTLSGGSVSANTTISTNTTTPTVVVNTQPYTAYGLEDGKIYQIAVFHAEREPEGSSFKLGLTGLDLKRSSCVKK